MSEGHIDNSPQISSPTIGVRDSAGYLRLLDQIKNNGWPDPKNIADVIFTGHLPLSEEGDKTIQSVILRLGTFDLDLWRLPNPSHAGYMRPHRVNLDTEALLNNKSKFEEIPWNSFTYIFDARTDGSAGDVIGYNLYIRTPQQENQDNQVDVRIDQIGVKIEIGPHPGNIDKQIHSYMTSYSDFTVDLIERASLQAIDELNRRKQAVIKE